MSRAWTLADLKRPAMAWGNADDLLASGSASSWPNRGTAGGAFAQSNPDWVPGFSSTGLAAKAPAVMWGGSHALELPVQLDSVAVTVMALAAYTGSDGGKRLVSLNNHNADYNDDHFAAIMKCSGYAQPTAEIERNGRTYTGGTPINTPALICTGFNGTSPFIRVNGIDQGVSADDTRAFLAQYITLGAWYLFGSSPIDNWTGPMSDVAVLDYTLAGDELLRAEASWLWDRQLPDLIDPASPYKAARPEVGGTAPPAIPARRRPVLVM